MSCELNILQRLRNLFTNWPPLVVFLFCLLSFSLVTFLLGSYVYRYRLVNPHVKSWNQFMSDVSRHRFCASPGGISGEDEGNFSSADFQQRHVMMRMSADTGGFSPLSNNKSVHLISPKSYSVSISAVPQEANSSRHVSLVCVHVRGGRQWLPSPRAPSPPSCNSSVSDLGPGGSLRLQVELPAPSVCVGSVYSVRFTTAEIWQPFLSLAERKRALRHMHVTSMLLALTALVLVLFVAARNRARAENPSCTPTSANKFPLTDE